MKSAGRKVGVFCNLPARYGGMNFYFTMAIATVAILLFLTQAVSKKVIHDHTGRFHLRMNKLYSLGGITAILLGLGLSITGLMQEISVEMIGLASITLGITWGLGITCLRYYYNHRVSFDNVSITVTSASGREVTFLWQDIVSARTVGLPGMTTIHAAGYKVKIHSHLVGYSTLRDLAKEKGWIFASGSTQRL